MHLDDGVDLIILLFWVIVGMVSVTFCYGVVSRNLQPYTLPDKSSLTAMKDNTPDPYQWTVRDYILMIMVADEYCPDPKAIDIKFGSSMESTLIEFDSDFLTHMEARLQDYYIDYLDTRVDREITSYDYYYGTGEEGRWRFIADN